MAEGVLFTVAGEILMKLTSLASQRLGMLCGLKDELAKLTSNVSAIRALLLDAEERQTKSRSLENWLEKLREALYVVNDVLDEFSYETLFREVMTRGKNAKQVRIFFSKSNQIAFNYRMARKVKNIWERLDAIAAEKDKFLLCTQTSEQMTQYGFSFHQTMARKETCSLSNEEEVIGRYRDKIQVKDALLDMDVKHNVSFIAIVGIGGIGKTTLARSFYNDKEISQCFELKIWVWVSDQFEIKVVVEKIIESATNCNPNVKGKEALQGELQKVICGRKFLLVMDDVWNENENVWNELKDLLMGGAKGSKIIITKRDRKLVAAIANITSLFCLEGIPDGESWLLFKKMAFIEGKEPTNQNLIRLGKEISRKCEGVPLLIRHIGRMLQSKTSEEEWRFFKDNELLKVTQDENEMTSILKLSYNYLSPNLKQCYAYSSLYTKNECIDKDKLIRQWVAQGFVESPNRSKSMEDTGDDYFMELCWRLFYEYHNGDVRMHDVMHDLATMVAGNGYVCGNLKNYDDGEKIHHVSLDHDIKSWNDLPSKLLEAKGLRTLHRRPEIKINEVVLDRLFSCFPRLRVLNLSCSNIKIVPNSLKKLRHLRYLDLSENKNLELLTNSIGELLNLQTLNLNGCCALKELPRDTNNLVNLRHLDLLNLNLLTHMPKGIGKLTCLQTLQLFVLDNNNNGSKLSELNELNDLRGELHIKGLEQLRCTSSEAGLAKLKDKRGLRDLLLEWKPDSNEYEEEAQDGLNDEKVLEGLEPHPNIESLTIWRYKGLRLPNWVSNSLFKLTDISIVQCKKLENLSQLDQLPALRNLYLRDITSLQYMDKNNPRSCSRSSVFFPSLEILILENMPNMEGWWDGESEENGLLPNFAHLTKLLISKCPKLSWLPRHPSLMQVKLESVGAQMVSNIDPLSNLNSLTLINIEDLEDLPITLQQNLVDENAFYSSSKRLEISNCPNFMSLPEWAVSSFLSIEIIKCPKFKSMPDRNQHMYLANIHVEGCPEIQDTFDEGGEKWLLRYWRNQKYPVRDEAQADHWIRSKLPSIYPDYVDPKDCRIVFSFG